MEDYTDSSEESFQAELTQKLSSFENYTGMSDSYSQHSKPVIPRPPKENGKLDPLDFVLSTSEQNRNNCRSNVSGLRNLATNTDQPLNFDQKLKNLNQLSLTITQKIKKERERRENSKNSFEGPFKPKSDLEPKLNTLYVEEDDLKLPDYLEMYKKNLESAIVDNDAESAEEKYIYDSEEQIQPYFNPSLKKTDLLLKENLIKKNPEQLIYNFDEGTSLDESKENIEYIVNTRESSISSTQPQKEINHKIYDFVINEVPSHLQSDGKVKLEGINMVLLEKHGFLKEEIKYFESFLEHEGILNENNQISLKKLSSKIKGEVVTSILRASLNHQYHTKLDTFRGKVDFGKEVYNEAELLYKKLLQRESLIKNAESNYKRKVKLEKKRFRDEYDHLLQVSRTRIKRIVSNLEKKVDKLEKEKMDQIKELKQLMTKGLKKNRDYEAQVKLLNKEITNLKEKIENAPKKKKPVRRKTKELSIKELKTKWDAENKLSKLNDNHSRSTQTASELAGPTKFRLGPKLSRLREKYIEKKDWSSLHLCSILSISEIAQRSGNCLKHGELKQFWTSLLGSIPKLQMNHFLHEILLESFKIPVNLIFRNPPPLETCPLFLQFIIQNILEKKEYVDERDRFLFQNIFDLSLYCCYQGIELKSKKNVEMSMIIFERITQYFLKDKQELMMVMEELITRISDCLAHGENLSWLGNTSFLESNLKMIKANLKEELK